MRGRPAVFLAASLLAAALSACADGSGDPTGLVAPDLTLNAASATTGAVVASSEPSPFVCTTSRRTTGGPYRYRYGRFYLHFPDGVAQVNPTTRFRYILPSASGEIFGTANCVIPASRAAITLTASFFRLSPEQVRPAGGKPGDLIIMCRGTPDDPCAIDGVVGTAPKLADDGGCDPTIHFGCDETNEGNPYTGGDPYSGWGDSGGGGDSPDPDDPTDPCNTGVPLFDSPEVQEAFDQIWQASNPDANLEDRRERGGWLIANSSGGYSFEAFPDSWSLSSCAIDIPPGVVPPNGTVSMVHTHPYAKGEVLTTCEMQEIPGFGSYYMKYGNNPSGEDLEALAALRSIPGVEQLIGIIIDKERITAYNGSDSPDGQVYVARCGY